MRRISAILVLVAFSLPLIAATFQDSDGNLPACCRRAGIHHCDGHGSTNSPALASGACRFFPTTASLSTLPKIVLPDTMRGIPAPAVNIAAPPMRGHNGVTAVVDDSNPKRGPPSLL